MLRTVALLRSSDRVESHTIALVRSDRDGVHTLQCLPSLVLSGVKSRYLNAIACGANAIVSHPKRSLERSGAAVCSIALADRKIPSKIGI
jgi:predicted transcriptional regulator